MKNIFNLLTVLFICISCNDPKEEIVSSSDGIWEQMGYGKIFEIKNDSVKIFDINKIGCNEYEHVELRDEGKVESYSKDSLTIRKNMKTYKFVRLEKLPDVCNTLSAKNTDPVYNFESLWSTFNEHYSFFETREVNWNEIYKKYKPQINNETADLQLYLIFEEMLDELNDGHVSIDEPEHLSDTLDVLNAEKEMGPKEKAKVNQFELGDLIANKYCKKVDKHNAGIVQWGMMKDSIAYVQLNAMWLLAYYDISQDLLLRDFYPLYGAEMEKRVGQREDEIEGADILMDSIVMDLHMAKALVFDLRFNQGGKDEAGLEFMGHFVKSRKKIASKKARLAQGFSNHQSMHLEPKEPHFDKNVYLLTSYQTASAAELAVLSSLPYSNFVRIGSNTEGIFSDGLDKKLPNGWDFRLSNEIYVDAKGINYEGIGIPPDIKIDYPKEKAAFLNMILGQLQSSGDEAIEEVFKIEKEK